MAVSKKVLDHLTAGKYKFEVIEHRKTYTAWDTAQTEKVKPEEVAKALVVSVDKDHVIAVVPSNKNLDKKKLLKLVNAGRKKKGEKPYKKIGFAKESWMKKNIYGKVGATPPFKEIIKVDIYLDKILAKNSKIYLGSGEYDASIRVNSKDYIKKEEPIVGGFNAAKK